MSEDRIPRIIHYCWFGGKEMPELLKNCLDSWKILKNYTVIRWDESNCEFNENEYVKEAFQTKRWGFLSDYYRLKALNQYGGIYLDTDVVLNRSLDPLLKHTFFLNFIYDCSIGAGIMGAIPNHPVVKDLLNMYEKTKFEKPSNNRVFEYKGEFLYTERLQTCNYYYTYYFLKHFPQFKLNNKYQDLGNVVIYPKEYFEIGSLRNKHYAIHLSTGLWRESDNAEGKYRTIKRILSHLPRAYDFIHILLRRYRYRKYLKEIPFYAHYLAQKKGHALPDL